MTSANTSSLVFAIGTVEHSITSLYERVEAMGDSCGPALGFVWPTRAAVELIGVVVAVEVAVAPLGLAIAGIARFAHIHISRTSAATAFVGPVLAVEDTVASLGRQTITADRAFGLITGRMTSNLIGGQTNIITIEIIGSIAAFVPSIAPPFARNTLLVGAVKLI